MTLRLQDRFFEMLNRQLAEHGYDAVVQYRATNTGTVDVVEAGTLGAPLLSFAFHFQAGHNVFESQTPLWPEGRTNPRMFIGDTAGSIGRALGQIMKFVAGSQTERDGGANGTSDAARKTIEVAQLIEWVNARLAVADSTHRLDGRDATPEQAFRLGIASLLEQALHATGNYRGFGYQASELHSDGKLRDAYDPTRTRYHGAP